MKIRKLIMQNLRHIHLIFFDNKTSQKRYRSLIYFKEPINILFFLRNNLYRKFRNLKYLLRKTYSYSSLNILVWITVLWWICNDDDNSYLRIFFFFTFSTWKKMSCFLYLQNDSTRQKRNDVNAPSKPWYFKISFLYDKR